MARIVCLGEAMLELSRSDADWSLGYGGDTLNTAIHLARSGHDVAYLSALGSDAFSEQMRGALRAEGIDCSLLLTHPSRQAGLYAIDTDAAGERSFAYWRDVSAAREMFLLDDAEVVLEQAAYADLLYFSAISLAILPPSGRDRLLALACEVRVRGGKVAFDSNYRPHLWETTEVAASTRDAAIAVANVGLPTFEDERDLSQFATPQCVARHWRDLGCEEVIVKTGGDGCLLDNGEACLPPERLYPVDTSGAGDAFNAGYLATRLRGAGNAAAAGSGHAYAGWTVMRRGAIPAWDDQAPYPER